MPDAHNSGRTDGDSRRGGRHPPYRPRRPPRTRAIHGAGALHKTLTALVWTVRGEAGLIAPGAVPAGAAPEERVVHAGTPRPTCPGRRGTFCAGEARPGADRCGCLAKPPGAPDRRL